MKVGQKAQGGQRVGTWRVAGRVAESGNGRERGGEEERRESARLAVGERPGPEARVTTNPLLTASCRDAGSL